jgi:hypothetical protein
MDLHPPTSTSTNWLVCQETAKKHPDWKRAPGFWSWGPRGSGAMVGVGKAKPSAASRRVGWTRPRSAAQWRRISAAPHQYRHAEIRKRLSFSKSHSAGEAVKRAGKGATTDDRILQQLKARVTCPRARTSLSPPRPVVCHKGGDDYDSFQQDQDPELWITEEASGTSPEIAKSPHPAAAGPFSVPFWLRTAAVVRAGQGKAA